MQACGALCKFIILLALIVPQVARAGHNGLPVPTGPVSCEKDMRFDRWRDEVIKEARAMGVSQATISAALPLMNFDADIIRRDQAQGVFQQSFLQFSDRMVSQDRLNKGAKLLKTHRDLFARIEREFGVPPQVLVAFWGLESDFGSHKGKISIVSAVTTLAYNCRRAPMFRRELLDALRIIDRGDQRPQDMYGDWAGEFGGMQITPSDYFHFAVDYDRDGRRDLIHSLPDTMASAANFLKNLGWRAGEMWMQEVRVPMDMPWQEADLAIQHPRSQWARWGVRAASGSLATDAMPASLWLPMGRLGPAFLVFNNFKAYLGWNSAMVYSTTAAYYATRLAGAGPVARGAKTVQILSPQQMLELQKLLIRAGFDVGGKPDGKLGSATRSAIKKAQIKVGLPADSYPTVELIEKLKKII